MKDFFVMDYQLFTRKKKTILLIFKVSTALSNIFWGEIAKKKRKKNRVQNTSFQILVVLNNYKLYYKLFTTITIEYEPQKYTVMFQILSLVKMDESEAIIHKNIWLYKTEKIIKYDRLN